MFGSQEPGIGGLVSKLPGTIEVQNWNWHAGQVYWLAGATAAVRPLLPESRAGHVADMQSTVAALQVVVA